MLAIHVRGKAEPILVARVSSDKRRGLRFEDENGKQIHIDPNTIEDVVDATYDEGAKTPATQK